MERKLITLLTKITEKTGSMKDYIVEQGTKISGRIESGAAELRNAGGYLCYQICQYKTRERYTGLIIVFHFLQVYSLTYPL